MENKLFTETFNNLPELVKHTHLNINLDGWPAAVTAISGCIAIVAIYAMKTTHQEAVLQYDRAA